MNFIERLFLKMLLRRLEKQIGKDFAPILSQRIDCIRYLLEYQ
jgi:hypothetical protein